MDLSAEVFRDDKKIEEAQRHENDQLLSDYKLVLATPEGRRVLWDIMEMAHMYSLSMTGNSNTYFREGERNIGLRVLGRIVDAEPGAYAEMLKLPGGNDNG